jgi:hypothetical protein
MARRRLRQVARPPSGSVTFFKIKSFLWLCRHLHQLGRPLQRLHFSSSKLLQTQHPTIWWTVACPWHGQNSNMQLHSSAMLGACLLRSYGAIYSQSRALGSWRSDGTMTT